MIGKTLRRKNGKKMPATLQMAKNFGKALVKHIRNNMKKVDTNEYIKRIEVCNGCDSRQDNRCLECGCFLDKKAWWASEECPRKKWR